MNNNLRNVREQLEINQNQVCKVIGISNTVVCKWENGSEIIPLKHLNSLANYYNVSMDYLLGLSNNKNNFDRKINELNKIEVGKRIKLFREKKKLSLRDLAKILNTTSSTISAYETGKTLILTSFAYQICKEYNISLDYLCGRRNKE